jgi:tetratricopeptide (TPR) repeat protein
LFASWYSISLKLIVLLLGLVLSTLLITGLVALPVPWLATTLSFFSVLMLPGFLALGLVYSKRELPWSGKLPLSLVLSIGLLSPLAMLLLALQANLVWLSWALMVVYLVLGGLYIRRWHRQPENAFLTRILPRERLNPFLLFTFALSIIVVLAVFLSTASAWSFGDNWTYLLLMRRYLDGPLSTDVSPFPTSHSPMSRAALSVWWVLLAFVDRVAGMDPLDLYSFYLPPLLLVGSLLAFYSLARELFGRKDTAVLATVIQVIYCLSSIGSHDWIGQGFFDRIVEDKFLVWLVILPMAILVMLRYFSNGNKTHLTLLALAVSALALTHPIGLLLLSISSGAFAMVHLALNWEQTQVRRAAHVFGLMIMCMLIPLVQRQMVASTQAVGAAFDYATGLEKYQMLYNTRLWVFSALRDQYIAHPQLIAHPLMILVILLAPLLIRDLRNSLAAQFLFSNMAATLLLLYNPLTAPLLGRLITPWMLWRVSWLLPVALTVGFFLDKIARWIQARLASRAPGARPAFLFQMVPLLLVALIAIPLQPNIAEGLGVLRDRAQRTMSRAEKDLLVHLREHVTQVSTVMAEPSINSSIPAFSSVARVLTFREADSLGAAESVDRFYRSRLVSGPVLKILDSWDVRYVVIRTDNVLAFQLARLPAHFGQLYANDEYELYEVLPGQEDDPVIAGNTYLLQADWKAAIDSYLEALASNQADSLAAYGLGQVYQAQGRQAEAQTAYEEALVADVGNVPARLALAETYVALGEEGRAANLLEETTRLRPDYLPAFEVLGDLYLAQGQVNEALVQYAKAIDYTPGSGDYRLALGDLYLARGWTELAGAEYRAVIAAEPRLVRAAAYFRLGWIHQSEGRADEAVVGYQRAIDLAPDDRDAYIRLSGIYREQGRDATAASLYREAVRHNPNLAWPHLELGKIYLGQAKP